MSERDRGDRPKKSWRELDAARNKPRPSRDERGDSRSSGLDALCAKGEVGKLAEKMGPGSPRIDPHDLVRGTHRGGSDGPAMSGAGSGSSSTPASGAAPATSSPERVSTKAP